MGDRFKARLGANLEAERREQLEREEREQEQDGFGWDLADPTNMSLGFGGGDMDFGL